MRDYAIFIFILGPIPLYFLSPVLGILTFHFVAFLNPHRFAWGPAYDFPFSYVIAFTTILGIVLGRGERNKLPIERETWLFLLIWIVFLVSALFSIDGKTSWVELLRVSKIFLMMLLTLYFFCSEKKLRYLFWVVVLSIGFLGIKGGIFGILTGGSFRVWGPADSFIADNNDLGMAINMSLPIVYAIAATAENRKTRTLLNILFISCVISVMLTFSRGAIVTLGFLLLVMSLTFGNNRMKILLFILVLVAASYFATDKWIDRVHSVSEASSDPSFQGRINAWHSAWNMAIDRPFFGGGIGTTNNERIFERYSPDPMNFHAPHSIYFQILGENGFIGIIIFLSLFGGLLISLHRVKRKMAHYTTTNKLKEYASGIELSLMAFLINGITLGRAYFDLAYLVIVMGIIVKYLMKTEIDIVSKGASEDSKVIMVGT